MNNDIQILNKQTIESMIYTIRGQKVMLDFELARIYGYETKNFARCKNFTSQIWATHKGGRVYLPYAFTKPGIYMLMTVLNGGIYE